LLDARECQVFLGMMQDIGVMRHVEHDVEHHVVVWRLALVKKVELALQQVEELGEIGVFGVPVGDGVGHGYLRTEMLPRAASVRADPARRDYAACRGGLSTPGSFRRPRRAARRSRR